MFSSMSTFTNRLVLVTGASGGLGESVTSRFLADGAQVVAVARHWTLSHPHPRLAAWEADLTRPEDCQALLEKVEKQYGRLDILAHILGGFAGGTSIPETSGETWRQMLDLNLSPLFYLARGALPLMRKNGWGRIVAVGSRPGLNPVPGLSAYSVSKAGVHALIRAIAAEVQGSAITANAVLPSVIDTPANRQAMPTADPSKWVAPASLAGVIAWLASDAAADVSGALVPAFGKS